MAERPERAGTFGRRLRFALLVAFVFGVPALHLVGLRHARLEGHVARGEQSGGPLTGVVVDEAGAPLAGLAVEVRRVALEGTHAPGPTAFTDAEGRFALELAPLDGHYELRVGGGELQRVVREVSFLDRDGVPRAPGEVELTVLPGARLSVALARGDGREVGGGTWRLAGTYGRGALFGLLQPRLERTGRFEDGALAVEGLPPLEGRLRIALDRGEVVDLELELSAGETELRVEL